MVATDYSFAEKGGPHPYLIGEGEARAVLDSVRAARQMSELTLDKRMVAWGYSQGGHAALWTGTGRDHFAIVQPDTPLEELLIKWTTARFADEPQPSGCVHKSF